jgi:NOL1/NOP2/fmu family ribosome biogenesis protein
MKEIIANFLERQFGISKEEFFSLNLEFEERGKRRVYAFKPCNLDIPTYHYGIYFGTLDDNGFRLSIEGCFLVGKFARMNVLVVDDEKAIAWMSGKDIECNLKGYVIVKWREFFLGCGKANGRILRNFVPKNRRVASSESSP